jgi:hypothetical protein
VVEAALADSDWKVELLLAPANPSATAKAYQGPTVENVPARLRDRCQVIKAASVADWHDRLADAEAVVATCGREFFLGAGRTTTNGVWCAVFDGDHDVQPEHTWDDADIRCWPSRYYAEWFGALRGLGPAASADVEEMGYVRADPLAWTSREEIRRQWGLPLDVPIVLGVPDDHRLWPHPDWVTDWYRHVWCVDGRAARVVRALLLRRSVRAFHEALELSPSYGDMLRAVRRFCDRQGALFVMAPRRPKNRSRRAERLSPEERAVCDVAIEDMQDYPQTFPRAAKMADLVVSPYRSGCLLDALAAGVPYVTSGRPSRANPPYNELYAQRFDREQGHHPGATWLIPAPEFTATFGERTLRDFALDPVVLARARARYLGPVDGMVSERILRAIRRRLESR